MRCSPISSLAAAGIGFDGYPLPGPAPLPAVKKSSGWGRRLAAVVAKAWFAMKAVMSTRANAEQDALDDNETEAMQAWSITARLAAVSSNDLSQVPEEVASLILQAKDLHPQVDVEAAKRDG